MRLGDILVARGLVSEADVQRAIEYQTKSGGRLGDILVAMRAISQETIEAVLHDAPEAPKKIEATGVDGVELMKLMIKDMYVASRELRPSWPRISASPCRSCANDADGGRSQADRGHGHERQGRDGAALPRSPRRAAAGPPRRSSNAAMSASRRFRSRNSRIASSARRSPTSASARKSCRSSSATSSSPISSCAASVRP